ncbi:MAG: DUF805 domain-containing protein [Cognatishimia sp.]|uniref:DUF805 domain-containing protein n=1 Tax=Cognatishimia sp. TaxID=2211648 RepID=UPI004058E971
MSKPVVEDLFTFSGRRNRQSYILFILLTVFITLVTNLLVAILAVGESVHTTMGVILIIVVSIPLSVAGFAVGAQRCRDFGWSGWAICLTLIPLVGLLFGFSLLVISGTKGENRYGPDPLGRENQDLDTISTTPDAN